MTQKLTILFDLDGTLVDTAPDLINAHNHVMKKFGYEPSKSDHEVKSLIGKGASTMISRSLWNSAKIDLKKIKNVIGKKPIIHSQEALYLAGANEILAQLSKINNNHNTALLIGHNPGLDILAQTLTGKGSNGAAAKNLQKGVPTAAMAIFKLKGNSWQSLTSDGAELLTFLLPSE